MTETRMREAWQSHQLGDFAKAEKLYKEILRTDPRNFDAHYRLGFLYGECAQFENAEVCMGEAIKLAPSSADAHFLRGSALLSLGRADAALPCLAEAAALNSHLPEMQFNLAVALYRLKRYAEAAAIYDTLLSLAPDYPFARGYRMFCRLNCCDWRSLDDDRAAIAAGLNKGGRVIAPFDAKALGFWPAQELQCARLWAAETMASRAPLAPARGHAHHRIRIAYLAAGFGEDPVSTLLAGVIEAHDTSRFETIAVSFGVGDGSARQARLKSAFGHFIGGAKRSDVALASELREREVDIAVDLMGFTQGCRPGVFALKPAPIQINYLGFPGTMGAAEMDYILADRIVIPDEQRTNYSENVVYLPDTFFPSDRTRPIAAHACRRSEAGLPDNGFVFASFNNSYKFTPRMFDIWMRLLKSVEESVLWLPASTTVSIDNLKREAEVRGVSAGRLVFAPYLPSAKDHLARLRLADLFLDTLPYNAHTTASDALWAGLPVLTCMGDTFAGRVAASLLQAAGLPELVTPSLDAYETLALKLARDPPVLAAIKARLAQNRDSCALFDTARFTRHLEAAYTTMWERCGQGVAPSSFAVERQP